jgi:hypothetical protein
VVQTTYSAVIPQLYVWRVLWGFATKAQEYTATACYVMSVLPALWVFLMSSWGLTQNILSYGWVCRPVYFWTRYFTSSLARWWLHLRGLLTTIVLLAYP